MKQEIKVEIDMNTGAITGDIVCGPGGSACESMLDEILGSFDKQIAKKKPEFFQTRQTISTQKIGK